MSETNDARLARYAEALQNVYNRLTVDEDFAIARAVVAVADAEQAGLKAEVEQKERLRHEWYVLYQRANDWSWELHARAESAEAALVSEREAHAGLRARLEALANEWEALAEEIRFTDLPDRMSTTQAGRRLRAILAEPAAPVAAEEGGSGPTEHDKPRVRSASYLSPHQMHRLDLACLPIRKAFPDHGPYLVGSVFERADYRDVDVRVILIDKQWDRMFGKGNAESDGGAHRDARWLAVCSAFSHWLSDVSGLPVDFQIQRMTEANANPENEGKFRNPLGVREWTR